MACRFPSHVTGSKKRLVREGFQERACTAHAHGQHTIASHGSLDTDFSSYIRTANTGSPSQVYTRSAQNDLEMQRQWMNSLKLVVCFDCESLRFKKRFALFLLVQNKLRGRRQTHLHKRLSRRPSGMCGAKIKHQNTGKITAGRDVLAFVGAFFIKGRSALQTHSLGTTEQRQTMFDAQICTGRLPKSGQQVGIGSWECGEVQCGEQTSGRGATIH